MNDNSASTKCELTPQSRRVEKHEIARRDEFVVSTDPARIDVAFIHAYLSERSYWAPGNPRDVVQRSIDHSLCFGLYEGSRQIGFARMITDRATFAYLADVFVVEEARGQGLGTWLVQSLLEHPDLQGLRRLLLGTLDAHSLYTRFGFAPLAEPSRFLEIVQPDMYRSAPRESDLQGDRQNDSNPARG